MVLPEKNAVACNLYHTIRKELHQATTSGFADGLPWILVACAGLSLAVIGGGSGVLRQGCVAGLP